VAPDGGLRLRAEDADDLAVISACVQDALVSVRDLTYDRVARTFTLVANRFRWEGQGGVPSSAPAFERTHAALTLTGVKSVSYRGFRRSDEDRILALLALRVGDKPGTVDLEFSGKAAVRIVIDRLNVRVTDIGEPWPTAWQPDHAAGEPT
jgi:hypothetical protein